MLKKFFLLFFFVLTAYAKKDAAGIVSAALGECNKPVDYAVYMAVPTVSMLINSIKQCKADLVRQKQLCEQQRKENLILEEKYAKREISKATFERELKIAE